MRKLKENLQLPHESHTITQDESKEEHSRSARGKCERKNKKKNKESESSCLDVSHLYNGGSVCAFLTTFDFGHNQTLNFPLQEYQRRSAKVLVIFFSFRKWVHVRLTSCARAF